MQRATTLFHLGLALAAADYASEAVAALRESCELFDPDRLPVEHAKAKNALGAAQRATGAAADAAATFADAADRFAEAELRLEEGAARYNLGLALRALARTAAAGDAFEAARSLLARDSAPAQAAAAARELGAVSLEAGDVERAVVLLDDAAELAERAGDRAGAGAAWNVRGLAELARGRPEAAAADFRAAASAHPRSVRPADHAMAKANLALAYERCDQRARARLAARQALVLADVPEPIRGQAQAIVERLGTSAGDVVAVLREAPRDDWTILVRDELDRWPAEPPTVRRDEAGAWIEAQTALPEPDAIERAELLLGVVLELPPEQMETVIASLLEAAAPFPEAARESFRSSTSQAMARFHVPQLIRLRDTFARIDAELGTEAWR